MTGKEEEENKVWNMPNSKALQILSAWFTDANVHHQPHSWGSVWVFLQIRVFNSLKN